MIDSINPTPYYPPWRNESKPCRDVFVAWAETPYPWAETPDTREIDVGIGYRHVNMNEELQDGDEFFSRGKWFRTGSPGCRLLIPSYVYRRKVFEPVDLASECDYYYLKSGDVIQHGDEFQPSPNRDPEWWKESCDIGMPWRDGMHYRRRKIEKPIKPTYTFVEFGDVMLKGDEYLVDRQWTPVESMYFDMQLAVKDCIMRRRMA